MFINIEGRGDYYNRTLVVLLCHSEFSLSIFIRTECPKIYRKSVLHLLKYRYF